jgi:hypothetical protein
MCVQQKKKEGEKKTSLINSIRPRHKKKGKSICVLIYVPMNIFGRDDNDRH